MGHSPWGRKESDRTEHTHTHRLISTVLYSRQYYYPNFAGEENKVKKFAKHYMTSKWV